MDIISFLPTEETLFNWLTYYGSFSLFILMALGIILLPVPEETLMVTAGILISQGKLEALPTMLAAYLGSMCGITGSYLIGRTIGYHLLEKYGSWVGVTTTKIKRAHDWFEHYGKWTLVIGYFIPGVRHLTGICAGTSYLEYPIFALFAYFGAIFWVSTFLSIGYFFGDYWTSLYVYALSIADEIILGALAVVGLLLLWRLVRKNKSENK